MFYLKGHFLKLNLLILNGWLNCVEQWFPGGSDYLMALSVLAVFVNVKESLILRALIWSRPILNIIRITSVIAQN